MFFPILGKKIGRERGGVEMVIHLGQTCTGVSHTLQFEHMLSEFLKFYIMSFLEFFW